MKQVKVTRAFTLVELSMAIIIIGILIAGMTTGNHLLQNFKLNKVITNIHTYRIAYHNFTLKYDAIPGDMNNATSYFSGTANGNGSSFISDAEVFDAWQHLSLSGIVEGSYNGVGSGASLQECTELSCPIGSLNELYFFRYDDAVGVTTVTTQNFLMIGGYKDNAYALGAIFTGMQAYSIDKKIDDGLPRGGFVYAVEAASGTDCTESSDTVYSSLNDSVLSCHLEVFMIERL